MSVERSLSDTYQIDSPVDSVSTSADIDDFERRLAHNGPASSNHTKHPQPQPQPQSSARSTAGATSSVRPKPNGSQQIKKESVKQQPSSSSKVAKPHMPTAGGAGDEDDDVDEREVRRRDAEDVRNLPDSIDSDDD
eukprot:ANDGO_04961.mRNA.1 hypothetical protein